MNWTQDLRPARLVAAFHSAGRAAGGDALFRARRRQAQGVESAFAGFLMAVVIAMFVFGMPASLIAWSAVHGAVFGLFRIAWIIIASIFLYHVAVETGQFQVMKDSIAALSSDRRLQAVLIAFCFGAFLEGTGGGGAPVAIAGAFLIGLGFPPFQAAGFVSSPTPRRSRGAASAIRFACSPRSRVCRRWICRRWPAASCRRSRSSCRSGSCAP